MTEVDDLEIVADWGLKIDAEEAKGLEISVKNTEKNFRPMQGEERDFEGYNINVDVQHERDPQNKRLSTVYIAVKRQPGTPYPRRLVDLLQHDVQTRFQRSLM